MIEIKSIEFLKYKNSSSNSLMVNFTETGTSSFKQLSPYFAWGNIPIPYSPTSVGVSLHSIWEGLKVFELCDVDIEFMHSFTKSIRSEIDFGRLKGFRRGIDGHVVFTEIEARKRIYIKIYKWILENNAYKLILDLRKLSNDVDIIFIDESTNCNLADLSSPISTAFLVKSYIEGTYPYQEVLEYKTDHHYYVGRRSIDWITVRKIFKELPPKINNNFQSEIEFDF